MRLEDEKFLETIKATPLVSIDLVIANAKGGMLVGKRLNEPARNFWFVPGGRIRKGETIAGAFQRISQAELNTRRALKDARLIGAFDHIYDTNFAEVDHISTHYVVLAYALRLDIDLKALPKTQHSEWKWASQANLSDIHPNTSAYFQFVPMVHGNLGCEGPQLITSERC